MSMLNVYTVCVSVCLRRIIVWVLPLLSWWYHSSVNLWKPMQYEPLSMCVHRLSEYVSDKNQRSAMVKLGSHSWVSMLTPVQYELLFMCVYRLSEYVSDKNQSSAIVERLLPFLSKHVNTSTETAVLISSVFNLCVQVEWVCHWQEPELCHCGATTTIPE